MNRARIAGLASAAVLLLVTLAAVRGARRQRVGEPVPTSPAIARVSPPDVRAMPTADEDAGRGALHGRITTHDGATYEGRLRWGGNQEAFWSDTFNGVKDENPWMAHVPPGRLHGGRRSLEIFGMRVLPWRRRAAVERPFTARFGDIARIEARGLDVRVTLRSGTVLDLDRLSASDFDDGVRVWDDRRGVVDLDATRIRTIELLPSPATEAALPRLHGTVRTPHGSFTGFLQWDRQLGVGSDELLGHAADGQVRLRFDSIRTIARGTDGGCLVTLLDGRDILLPGDGDIGSGHRGISVDEPRYGRLLVPWESVDLIELSPAGDGPAHEDFPPGHPLRGSVTTRDGGRLAGRIVYDLDESETTDTLDAPSHGVDYAIPFGWIASIVPSTTDDRGACAARVALHGGEELQLECSGDLGDGNAGVLVFIEGRPTADHVAWADVERVELDNPPAQRKGVGTR